MKEILLVIAGYCLFRAHSELKIYLAYKALMKEIQRTGKDIDDLTVGDILNDKKEK